MDVQIAIERPLREHWRCVDSRRSHRRFHAAPTRRDDRRRSPGHARSLSSVPASSEQRAVARDRSGWGGRRRPARAEPEGESRQSRRIDTGEEREGWSVPFCVAESRARADGRRRAQTRRRRRAAQVGGERERQLECEPEQERGAAGPHPRGRCRRGGDARNAPGSRTRVARPARTARRPSPAPCPGRA